MTDRGLPIVDGAPACPFVAFEEDRDERATSPDHRHRCYAEVRPAPRALAHQEAYCLSSSFPVCPTFQDWARREAARAREANLAAPAVDDDGEARRNPPRDWSAPPPWSGGPGGAAAGSAASAGSGAMPAGPGDAGDVDAPDPEPPSFLSGRSREGQGLAGSPADRLAGDRSEPIGALPEADPDHPGAPPVADAWSDERAAHVRPRSAEADPHGPSWERPRRYEAYPTIRTRIGLPAIPPIGMMAAAIIVAALALFFLPALLGFGEPDRGAGTPTPSPSVGASPSGSDPASGSGDPSIAPGPSQQTYIVQSGDTMSTIASRFGVSLDDLIAANLATVPDPDKLDVGDELIIPGPSTAPVFPSDSPSGEASPSP